MDNLIIISIDGIPGSGKTSTALWLGDMLEKKGAQVRIVPENEFPHPVRFVTDLNTPLTPWLETDSEHFSEFCIGKFNAFLKEAAEEGRQDEIVILDGLLFHTDSTSLLLMNPKEDFFMQHVRTIYLIGMQYRFLPILLFSKPYGAAVRHILAQRSAEWKKMQIEWKTSSPFCKRRRLCGEAGYLAFYQHYEERMCDVFTAITRNRTPQLAIKNPAKNWSTSRNHLWSICAEYVYNSSFFSDLL